jgi:hypothetical protein
VPLLFARSKGGGVVAYQRSQLIELRGPIMELRAQFLSAEPARASSSHLARRA